MQSEIIVKQNEISEMSQTDGIEVDELIVAKTPLEKQIFKNHCEDLAIQDCLYELRFWGLISA